MFIKNDKTKNEEDVISSNEIVDKASTLNNSECTKSKENREEILREEIDETADGVYNAVSLVKYFFIIVTLVACIFYILKIVQASNELSDLAKGSVFYSTAKEIFNTIKATYIILIVSNVLSCIIICIICNCIGANADLISRLNNKHISINTHISKNQQSSKDS